MVATVQSVTDSDLREAVVNLLESKLTRAAANINVATEKGIVTLTGFVRNADEKFAAERAVKEALGVKAVADDIEIKPSYERTDTEIARDVLRTFQFNVCLPQDRIKVTVRDRQVILEGSVHWQFQRMIAQAAVRSLHGIKSITNNIEVRPEEFNEKIEPAEVLVLGGEVQESGVAWVDSSAGDAG